MANTNLKEAKAAKNDEFYTQFHDIEIEMNAYLEYDPMCFEERLCFFLVMIQNGATLPDTLLPNSMSWA
mgnify:CR=1 FL=1